MDVFTLSSKRITFPRRFFFEVSCEESRQWRLAKQRSRGHWKRWWLFAGYQQLDSGIRCPRKRLTSFQNGNILLYTAINAMAPHIFIPQLLWRRALRKDKGKSNNSSYGIHCSQNYEELLHQLLSWKESNNQNGNRNAWNNGWCDQHWLEDPLEFKRPASALRRQCDLVTPESIVGSSADYCARSTYKNLRI